MALIAVNVNVTPIVRQLERIATAVEKLLAAATEGEDQQPEVDALTDRIEESSNILAGVLEPGSPTNP